MGQSSIEWTEKTWNPTTGCDKVSAGCKFCYAETMSARLHAMGQKKYVNNFKFTIHPESVHEPYKWKKPSLVFVNSMSDLFHEDMPLDFLKEIFNVMNNTPHTYQVLTKRPWKLAEWSDQLTWSSNIWMGTSVEDDRVEKRISDLKKCGAMIKFLSVEPLIGELPDMMLKGIDWVIVGGESGHGARPIKKEWVTDIKEQCEHFTIPFFFKQWGKPEFNPNPQDPTINSEHPQHAKGGCELDGVVYRNMPEELNFASL